MALVVVVVFTATPQIVYAQLSKKQEKTLKKERDKEYKKKITEYKNEGWKLGAGSPTHTQARNVKYKKVL